MLVERVGVVLLQDGHPIAYKSKKLNDAQRNYSAYECEVFAIVHALKTWRHYLYGATFEVFFDHESIKWFLSQKDLKGRKARWAKFLQDIDCMLWYCKGRYNVVADTLSRMPKFENLSFTVLNNDFLESMIHIMKRCGKCF